MQKDNDQKWFDLLGNELTDEDGTISDKTATSLRKIIKEHDDKINYTTNSINQGLEKLKFRLRKEGLVSRFPSLSFNFEFTQLAVAASIFVAVGMGLQAGIQYELTNNSEEELIYRGSGNEIAQLVSDPSSYLDDLETQLNHLNANYSVSFQDHGIYLEITLNENVRNYLQSRRIEINSSSKTIILKIQKNN